MERIDRDTALELLKTSDLLDLGERADNIRKKLHNVCVNKCKFCAFYRDAESPDAYLLDKDEIFKKIDETIALGGTQILLQGGIHPSPCLSGER